MEICADVGQSEGPGPATSAELRLPVRETGAWAVRAGGGHGPPRSLQCVWSVPQALVQTPALSQAEWESQPQISTNVRAFNPLVRPFEKAQKDFFRG